MLEDTHNQQIRVMSYLIVMGVYMGEGRKFNVLCHEQNPSSPVLNKHPIIYVIYQLGNVSCQLQSRIIIICEYLTSQTVWGAHESVPLIAEDLAYWFTRSCSYSALTYL